VIQNSSKSLLGFISQQGSTETYIYSVAVLCGELLKIAVCLVYLAFQEPSSLSRLPDFLWKSRKDLAPRLTVPAVVYFVQQNLEFLALYHMNAPMFQVLVQMKLLTAAAFSVTLLGRRLTRVQWVSLFILSIGVSLAQMQPKCDTKPEELVATDSTGLFAAVTLVTLSGFAGVYTEKVLKGPETAEVPFCFMQILLALVSIALGGIAGLCKDYNTIITRGLFYKFNGYTWLVIIISAAGGLLVAATLKYASSIAKGYAVSLAVVLTGVVSWLFFATEMSIYFCFGVAIVVSSLVLYNEGAVQKPKTADEPPPTEELTIVTRKNCNSPA